MNVLLRGLRGDLRLALRPSCLLIFIGVAAIAGLSSAVTQSVSSDQLAVAGVAVDQRTWSQAECGDRTPACQRQARSDDHRFLAEQQRVAQRIGALQTTTGTISYAGAFVGLGAGIVAIALFATLILGGDWARGTIGLAMTGGVTPVTLAMRRFAAVCALGCGAVLAAWTGAAVAALWGRASVPLPGSDDPFVMPAVGAVLVIVSYSAIASAVAWITRDVLRTLFVSVATIGLLAFTTPSGRYSPGAAIVSALGIDRRLEFEIGLLWIWPQLSFAADGTSPAHVVEGVPWLMAVAWITAITVVAVTILHRRARSSDVLA